MTAYPQLAALAGGLVVSCQALDGEPLHGPVHMSAMAQAALKAGAVGIRANGAEDIRAIRALTDRPIIGIKKFPLPDGRLFITPDAASAREVVEAGASIVALDCTHLRHPDDGEMAGLIEFIQDELGIPAMADCATLADAKRADRLGAAIVATTLVPGDSPDFALLGEILAAVGATVIAEGHFWQPEELVRALHMGTHAVVIGAAITDPNLITARFLRTVKSWSPVR